MEFALVIPLLFILIANTVNFAGLYYALIAVGNGSRAAGDYMIMSSVAYSGVDSADGAGLPPLTGPLDTGSPADAKLVADVVGKDMSSLTNRNSIQVRTCSLSPSDDANLSTDAVCNICTNSGGAMSCSSGGISSFTNPSPDTSTGEGGSYTLAWVDVTYTYDPFIPLGFSFPGLGLYLTLPSNLVVHRQAVYRVLK